MRLNLRMIDPSEYKIAGAVTLCGWFAQQALSAYLALPWSVQALLQGLITIALGLGAITAQHFWRRYLKRNWPEEEKPKEL